MSRRIRAMRTKGRPLVGALTILMCVYAGWANAVELVVIASTNSSLKPGAILSGGESISLAADASVTLIASDGSRISLTGPFEGTPAPAVAREDGALLESLSKLVQQGERSASLLAVLRGGVEDKPEGRPDLWGVHLTRSDRYCVPINVRATLWWSKPIAGSVVTVRSKREPPISWTTTWPGKGRTVDWPSALPIEEDVEYVVFLDGFREAEVTLVPMPAELATDAHRVAWMADHDCTRQARRILDELTAGDL